MLKHVDILWTKPSELTFYGALGLALVLRSLSACKRSTTSVGLWRMVPGFASVT